MKETGGAQTSGLPPPSRLCPRRPRYLPYPGCQVVAVQQNRANRGPTRALTFSTNEGVSCCGERVQVFACSRQPVNHHACSQTSFRSRFRQISGEPPPPPRVRVDVPVCARLLFQALLRFEGCSLLLPPSNETPTDATRRCAKTRLFLQICPQSSAAVCGGVTDVGSQLQEGASCSAPVKENTNNCTRPAQLFSVKAHKSTHLNRLNA